ncbi:MAG: sulfotransferase [Phycisphaerales bacterium]|nr:sulfotransferase [Phycisphaerales bacterium]
MTQFNIPSDSGNPSVMTAYQKTVKNCRDLIEAGQYGPAVNMLSGALKQSPRDSIVLRMLGHSLMMLDAPKEAIHYLTFASKLDPKNPDLLCDLASALRRVDELRKAHQAADDALKIAKNYPRAIMVKARLLQSHGQSQRAYELVKESLNEHFDTGLLGTYGHLCRELKFQSEGIDAMRKGLEVQGLPRPNRQDILFVLGHLLDSMGEYDEAFDCFSKGNAMSNEGSVVDVEKYLERWSKEHYDSVPQADVDGSRAVFIVGMPRSGTTLTEQIIASHPSAGGVGESQLIDRLTKQNPPEEYDQAFVNECGKSYLDMLVDHFPQQTTKRVCDKMPENYYFLGFINRILPGSHIIHCRRNPIDTCLSIFFQRFGPRLAYATDLGNCADQFLVYTHIMKYITETLEIKVHDAVYEETTKNPESSIRAMLDHIGLPFDNASMEFHKSKKSVHTASAAQIRQPMYTSSSQRWKNYEKYLGPIIEKLSPVLD